MDQRALRDVFGCFATGVTIITGQLPDGSRVGLTANSFSSVSLEPPLILFCLERGANCADAFQPGHPFAVNILRDDQTEASNHFASKVEDKFADSRFVWSEGTNGAPILQGALAEIECDCAGVHDGGDHWIITGRITRAARDPSGDPLIFYRGGYGALSGPADG